MCDLLTYPPKLMGCMHEIDAPIHLTLSAPPSGPWSPGGPWLSNQESKQASKLEAIGQAIRARATARYAMLPSIFTQNGPSSRMRSQNFSADMFAGVGNHGKVPALAK